MGRVLELVLVSLIILTLIPIDAMADGDHTIVQVRTDAIPGADFDSVRTVMFDTDGSTVLWTVDHFADPARDYGLGVRVFEFSKDSDGGGTFIGVTSLLLAGGLVVERPWRTTFPGHAHDDEDPGHDFITNVITILLVKDFTPILQAFKIATLEEDRDGSGNISGGDILRYTIPFFTSHALEPRSVLRDFPDPYNPLIPGSVTTSSGTVRRGNLPSDSEIVVRFGSVPVDHSVEVSYLVRVTCIRPEIVNQAILALRLDGSTVHYRLLTDDPLTAAPNDPTVVPLNCGQGDPVPAREVANVFPPLVPQYTTRTVVIKSASLGTDFGPPIMTMNGIAVQTEIFAPSEDEEVVAVSLTAEMTKQAGVIQFTLSPADPQLPEVFGSIEIRPAFETAQEITQELGEIIAGQVGESLDQGLAAFEQARTHAHRDPASCKALLAELKSDLRFIAEQTRAKIAASGFAALQQAVVAYGSEQELDEIRKSAKGGVKLLDKLMKELAKKRGKARKRGKSHGLICPNS